VRFHVHIGLRAVVTPFVVAIAVVAVATGLVFLVYARRRPRTPRPLESVRVQLYRVGPQDRFIGIVTGDLRRVRCAEVWVNSENTAMQMARFDEFSVSSIIRYEGARRDGAGRIIEDRIADELARRVAGRQQVPAGTAIVTGSGELVRNRVRYIVHVAAVQGEPGAGFRQIREVGQCVTNALTEIDKIGDQPAVRTVLFPLLGTGQGGGELRQTVDALLSAAIDYFTAVPTTQLTTVYFLAYTDIELTVCESACRTKGLARGPNTAPTPDQVRSKRIHPSVVDADRTVLPTSMKLQMGFVVDVVEFGRRPAPDQEAVQQRLFALARDVLRDTGVNFDTTDHQWTGDGFAAMLPTDIDPVRVLSGLMQATHRRLAEDNRAYRDRIRLRMAVGVGLVGVGATGFAGSMIVDINRLVDCGPLREAARAHPESDVVILISDHVYAYVVRPGYLRPPAGSFQRVDVALKEFHESAWLWTAPAGTTGS
jgi:O-acetyl-ADP-ribose deacetylase (regulator of RNase III)